MRKILLFLTTTVLHIFIISSCTVYGHKDVYSDIKDKNGAEQNVIIFFDDERFITTEFSSLSDKPSEVLSGSYSLRGSYDGTAQNTSFLCTNCSTFPLMRLHTYEVSFDYRILTEQNDGFEVLFYSPSAALRNEWLKSLIITQKNGMDGTASLQCTLLDFDDYSIKWNIVGKGAIAIDNISIKHVNGSSASSSAVMLFSDIEATSALIAVSEKTITKKVQNRPSLAIFSPWTGVNPIDECDCKETPYSLIWTSRGTSADIESPHAVLSAEEKYRMYSDTDTLYVISAQWNAWMPSENTLSKYSPFFLDESFKPHNRSEYPETLMLNFEHRDWPALLAEKAANYKKAGFDGLLFDWWNNEAGNGRSTKKVEAVRSKILKKIRQKVGDGFVLMGNVNWNVEDSSTKYLSGVFLELWKEWPERPYSLTYEDEAVNGIFSIQRMEDTLRHWDSVLLWPKIIAVENWKVTKNNYISDRYSEENYRFAKLFAAMTCVIPENGYFLYADNNKDIAGSDHDHAYYDFYNTDFGKPVSNMITIKDGVAYKEYENGIIAYNRTLAPAVFVTASGMKIHTSALGGVFIPR
ncbi:hypothetical protein H0R92_10830 [Treponema sp. OMZ 840]|uniref:hypothetical protein n=1 Tax=Treponema sp. OMZ 840 TaxID=244313 RepID=UPI003D8E16A6